MRTATILPGWIRRSILADKQFRALYIANAVSKFGTHIGYVALPVLAQVELHAGPAEVGVLAALSTVSFLLIGLPAGVWVDRTRKRSNLIAADLTRAALVLTIPAAWALGALTLAQLYAVALFTGMAAVFFDIAHLSYLNRAGIDGDFIGWKGWSPCQVDPVPLTPPSVATHQS